MGINGPVEPTELEQRITDARVAAYAELERDDRRSTGDRAVWGGAHAEVVLGRVEQGWRGEAASADLPAEVCRQLREDRALRHPGSDPAAEERARDRQEQGRSPRRANALRLLECVRWPLVRALIPGRRR